MGTEGGPSGGYPLAAPQPRCRPPGPARLSVSVSAWLSSLRSSSASSPRLSATDCTSELRLRSMVDRVEYPDTMERASAAGSCPVPPGSAAFSFPVRGVRPGPGAAAVPSSSSCPRPRVSLCSASSSVLLPKHSASRHFFLLRATAEMKGMAGSSRGDGSFRDGHVPWEDGSARFRAALCTPTPQAVGQHLPLSFHPPPPPAPRSSPSHLQFGGAAVGRVCKAERREGGERGHCEVGTRWGEGGSDETLLRSHRRQRRAQSGPSVPRAKGVCVAADRSWRVGASVGECIGMWS